MFSTTLFIKVMLLTALEYLRGETAEKKVDEATLTSNKLEITGQHVQDVQCIKEKQASIPQDVGKALAGAKAVTGLSYQPTQQIEITDKWLIRFKFLGNVLLSFVSIA